MLQGAGTTIKGCLHSGSQCAHDLQPKSCPGRNNSIPANCTAACTICGAVCNGRQVTQTGFGINTAQLGTLSSAFMVGYMVACFGCAHLIHRVPPFKLVAVTGFVWSIAAVLSGLPGLLCDRGSTQFCEWYWLTLAARVFSGVGEAGIAVLAVPYIDDRVSSAKKGMHLAAYFMTIPVGTALGFIWGGSITELTGGRWYWAYGTSWRPH